MTFDLRTGVLTTMAAAVLAAPAFAADGLLITQRTTTGGASQEQKIQIEPTRIRIERAGATGQVMVFDGDAQVMRIINPANKTYTELTKADMERLGAQMNQMMTQMQDQLKNMPPEQRAQIESMMRGRGAAAMMGQAPKIEYQRAGSGHVGTWDCTKYDGLQDGKKVSELCTVSPSALGFSQNDFQVTQQMADFFKAFTPPGMTANELFSVGGGDLGFSGVPVSRTSVGPPEVSSELVSVEHQSFADAIFAVPDGYRKQALPMTGQGR